MKITTKLTLGLTAISCSVLAAYGYMAVRRQIDLFDSDLTRDGRRLGRALAASLEEVGSLDGHEKAVSLLRDIDHDERRISIRWVRVDGLAEGKHIPHIPLDQLEPLIGGEEISLFMPQEDGHGIVYSYVPMTLTNGPPGAVEVGESLEGRNRYIRTTLIRLLLVAGVIILLSAFAAFGLGSWLVGRPIARLVEKARLVGTGDLATTVQLRSSDELGFLAHELNAMSERLATATGELEHESHARRDTEQQLWHAERLTTVGKLAAGVAHEIGTPLNVISGRAKMISSGEVQGNDAKENARIIHEQSLRIAKIVRQLLVFARRRAPSKGVADVRDLVANTTCLFEHLERKHNVRFLVNGGKEPAMACLDVGQIEQVLSNMVLNGIQSMPQGGDLRIQIEAETRQSNGNSKSFWRLDVEDCGAGITEEDLSHIFEPFFTTKDVGEGTGLGLSVAYGIVREHGGFIDVSSKIGYGSRFSIFLPRCDTDVRTGDSA